MIDFLVHFTNMKVLKTFCFSSFLVVLATVDATPEADPLDTININFNMEDQQPRAGASPLMLKDDDYYVTIKMCNELGCGHPTMLWGSVTFTDPCGSFGGTMGVPYAYCEQCTNRGISTEYNCSISEVTAYYQDDSEEDIHCTPFTPATPISVGYGSIPTRQFKVVPLPNTEDKGCIVQTT